MGVLKTQVTVPDFYNGELATSTILVADKVNMLSAPPSPEEARERPFVFGAQELLPAPDMEFKKSEELSIFFQVYNAGLDAGGQAEPDPRVRVPQGRGRGREVLQQDQPADGQRARTCRRSSTRRSSRSPAASPCRWRSFGEGDYRLAVKITDKASGKTKNQDIKFTVKGLVTALDPGSAGSDGCRVRGPGSGLE